MAYDASPSSTHNPATGGTPTAAWGDIINGNFEAIGAAWTSYTPTWSGTIGNGTVTGAYLKIGRTVHYRISVTWGSTTSHAAATQTFTLPAAAHAFYVGNSAIGTGSAIDASTAIYTCTVLHTDSSSIVYMARDSNSTAVSNSAPFAFATGDATVLVGTYEAAA